MPSRRIGKRRWRWAVTATSQSPASHAPWLPRYSASSVARTTMGPDQPARILVVDDNADNVELLRARLEARGYIIDSATDGRMALEQVSKQPPDLILLDVMMPELDGYEVVRRLKSDEKLPFIPVIMQTAL